jgi:hypothetical protein
MTESHFSLVFAVFNALLSALADSGWVGGLGVGSENSQFARLVG